MVVVKRLIGQGVTDSQGKVSVGYDSNHTGTINIKAESKGLEANTTITVRDDILLLTGTNKIIQTGDTTTLTAKLPPKPGTVIEDQTIYLSKNVDSTDWSLDLTASKEIIQVGETTTLTMLVKDSNDNVKENIVLNLYKVDDSMAKELVATLVTDSTGSASYNYVGVGAGLLGFIAESGRLQSETYSVLDGTFLDRATSSNHNDNYFYPANYTRDFTRGEINTSVDLQGTNGGSVTHSVGTGMCFEMDLDEVTNYCQVNVVRTETGKSESYHGQNYSSACKVRIEVLPSQTIFKQIINGVETTLQTINNSTNNTMRIYFPLINNTNAKFKFKNFVIYPI